MTTRGIWSVGPVVAALAMCCFEAETSHSQSVPQAATELTYVQLYATPDGETHFREVRVPLTLEAAAPPAPAYALSALQPATTIRHVVFPPHWGAEDRDRGILHNASSARFISIRSGTMWMSASDGETRRFEPGGMVEVLDVAPSEGHTTWVGDEPVVALFSNHP